MTVRCGTAQKMGASARRDERQNQTKQKRDKEEEEEERQGGKNGACLLQKQVLISLYVVFCMVTRMVNS